MHVSDFSFGYSYMLYLVMNTIWNKQVLTCRKYKYMFKTNQKLIPHKIQFRNWLIKILWSIRIIHYPFWGFPLSDEWGLLSFSIKSTLAFGSYIQENKKKVEAVTYVKRKKTCTQKKLINDGLMLWSLSITLSYFNHLLFNLL